MLRAAVELEALMVEPRFTLHTEAEPALVAESDECAALARLLGEEADRLALLEPPPAADFARGELRRLSETLASDSIRPIAETRLLRLAASASKKAALSARLELYPRGMAAATALRLSLGSLLGVPRLTPELIRERVRGRYPEAEPLPDRPALDLMLDEVGGQRNVAASIKRVAGIKGDIDHFSATHFLSGLLAILRDSGHTGLVLVLDEVETLQRMRADTREKGLNALRQFIDEIDAGHFPGLFLLTPGTTAFFEGPQGVQRLPPLAQRLHVDFTTDARFDNPRAVQIRLPGFDLQLLGLVGRRVRDLFANGLDTAERVLALVDDKYIDHLAQAVTGQLGGRVGVAPRLFLKKLVADILDRVDQFPDFDPRRHYALTINRDEMSVVERAATTALTVDDIEFDQ